MVQYAAAVAGGIAAGELAVFPCAIVGQGEYCALLDLDNMAVLLRGVQVTGEGFAVQVEGDPRTAGRDKDETAGAEALAAAE